MPDDSPAELTPGRFRSLTGLSDKALRLYGDRGILVPAAIDSDTGYRSYSADQLRDGIALDLLRRAKIPLDDLAVEDRFLFEEHRGKRLMRRAMEDYFLDLAERVADGDETTLVAQVTEAGPAHWVGCEVPLDISTDPEDLEETFTSMSVDLPRLDGVLLDALRAERIELMDESWTTSVPGASTRMLLAHRVASPLGAERLRAVTEAIASRMDGPVRVTSGTLPARRELIHSWPGDVPTDDEAFADMTLSYLAVIAFARRTAEDGVDALSDTARRRVSSTDMFDPATTPEDVYDLSV